MKTFRWSTTLVLLALAAALFSVLIFLEVSGPTSMLITLLALAFLLVATLFGKKGV